MFQQAHNISFDLPEWLETHCQSYVPGTDHKSRMDFVISASRKNVEEGTGGPFAAAVFEIESGELVSLGVNLVMTQRMSFLHAEVVALAVAQRKLGSYDLGEVSSTRYELVTSTEPCAMCLGAIPWSGIRQVVSAARDEDARAIGFDEGAKPDNWMQSLNSRGINVIADVERASAISVLELYSTQEGYIYNAEK